MCIVSFFGLALLFFAIWFPPLAIPAIVCMVLGVLLPGPRTTFNEQPTSTPKPAPKPVSTRTSTTTIIKIGSTKQEVAHQEKLYGLIDSLDWNAISLVTQQGHKYLIEVPFHLDNDDLKALQRHAKPLGFRFSITISGPNTKMVANQ